VLLLAGLGIGILRYRLWDIDRLVNRTLVYGLLTAMLGAVYAGLVLVLGQLSGGFGTKTPSWAVAGATLAVAALFQPARAASSRPWTGASTAASTTRPRPLRCSPRGLATRSTWTRCRPSCLRRSTRRCSRPRRRSGCGHRSSGPAAGPEIAFARVPSHLGDGCADPDEMIILLAGERRLRPGPR
jgi:hypothetical protein